MTPGPRSIISFYDDLILLCYRNKGRWTTYGNIIDKKFIRGLEVRRNELENRLINRSSESEDEIKKRLSRFDQEESLKKEFDYTLINDNFETTFEELKNTVLKRIKNGN